MKPRLFRVLCVWALVFVCLGMALLMWAGVCPP